MKEKAVMEYTNLDAYEVGKKQKAVMWIILASVAGLLIPYVPYIAGIAGIVYAPFVVGIIGIVFVYQLAKALKLSTAWLWALLQFIPIVSLYCLIKLNQRATAVLRQKGVRVGIMGGDSAQLAKLRAP